MESVLANPASLTPLALLGLVAIQLLQLIGNHLKARADVAARHDDNLAGILKQVLDQQNASWERLAGTLSEIQNHMHGTNATLAMLASRLEQVERQLTPTPLSPPIIGRAVRARQAGSGAA